MFIQTETTRVEVPADTIVVSSVSVCRSAVSAPRNSSPTIARPSRTTVWQAAITVDRTGGSPSSDDPRQETHRLWVVGGFGLDEHGVGSGCCDRIADYVGRSVANDKSSRQWSSVGISGPASASPGSIAPWCDGCHLRNSAILATQNALRVCLSRFCLGSSGDGDPPVRSTLMEACGFAVREGQAIVGEAFRSVVAADRAEKTDDTMIEFAGTSPLDHGRMRRAIVSA